MCLISKLLNAEESSLDAEQKLLISERVGLTLEIQRHKLKASSEYDDEKFAAMKDEEENRNKSHSEWLKKQAKKKASAQRADKLKQEHEEENSRLRASQENSKRAEPELLESNRAGEKEDEIREHQDPANRSETPSKIYKSDDFNQFSAEKFNPFPSILGGR